MTGADLDAADEIIIGFGEKQAGPCNLRFVIHKPAVRSRYANRWITALIEIKAELNFSEGAIAIRGEVERSRSSPET
jgi:DNA-binding transcriptional regulator PaaX